MRFNKIFLPILLISFLSAYTLVQAQEQYPALKNRRVSPGKTVYYIDPVKGSDKNKGTGIRSAWKTFKPVNSITLSAGDVLNVVSAGTFRESLVLHTAGTQASPVKVKFAPGRYDFYPANAIKRQLHITNTNDKPYEPKAIAMLLDSCRFVNIEATGAKFVFRGKMIETYVNNSSDISINGLSYDYNRPTVSEFTVVKVTPNYADVAVQADSKYSVKDSLITWLGEGWSYQPDGYWQVLNTKTGVLSRMDMPIKILRFAVIEGDKQTTNSKGQDHRSLRIYFDKNPGFEQGFVYQNRDVTRDCAGIFMQQSKNIGLKNIRIYFMHGMGVVSQFCENISMDNIVVRPDVATGKTCAAWADILHFAGCKGKIEIANSYLSGANDDAINVHGIHLKIIEKPASNQLKVAFMHGQTYGFEAYQPQDSIEFIHPESLLSIGKNVVLEAKRLDDEQILLTLKDAVPDSVKVNDAVENTTATPELWVHHTNITRIPTRGILATTRRKVVIEENSLLKTNMSAIFINDDASGWYESGMVKDVTISNNHFVKCGEPVINIFPENTVNGNTPVHNNIIVNANVFDLLQNKAFWAKSTGDITITDNIISTPAGVTTDDNLLKLDNCTNITIDGNKIVPLKK